MIGMAIALALAAIPQAQERVPELTLGTRTGAIAEPFSDAMGLAELTVDSDGFQVLELYAYPVIREASDASAFPGQDGAAAPGGTAVARIPALGRR